LDGFLVLKYDWLPTDSGKVKVPPTATTALGGSGAAEGLKKFPSHFGVCLLL
jgi:hypothetical protein